MRPLCNGIRDLLENISVANIYSFHTFKELIKMQPVWLTHDMQLYNEPDNLSYAKQLADRDMKW
jgi:hypothetical protein